MSEDFEVIIPTPGCETIEDVFDSVQLKTEGDNFTFTKEGPITTEIVYKGHKSYKLTRKYIAGETEHFEFHFEPSAIESVLEKIKDMRNFLKYVGKKPDDLQVNHFINSKGDRVWNVSLPRGTKYSVIVNMVCIFTLSEVKE